MTDRDATKAHEFIAAVCNAAQHAIKCSTPPLPFYVSPVVMEQVRKLMGGDAHYIPSSPAGNAERIHGIRIYEDDREFGWRQGRTKPTREQYEQGQVQYRGIIITGPEFG